MMYIRSRSENGRACTSQFATKVPKFGPEGNDKRNESFVYIPDFIQSSLYVLFSVSACNLVLLVYICQHGKFVDIEISVLRVSVGQNC